jgi:hypothetical protein
MFYTNSTTFPEAGIAFVFWADELVRSSFLDNLHEVGYFFF